MTAVADAFRPGVESTLGIADEPVDVLRERLLLAMRYTFSWQKALSDAVVSPAYQVSDLALAQPLALGGRVSAMQDALAGLLDAMPLSDRFPRKDAAALYETTSATFAQLYRDLALSLATLPQLPLLDQLGDLGSAVFKAPGAVAKTLAEQVAGGVRDLLGGTIAALWSRLWPFILLGAAGGVVYVFRAPIGRAIGRAAQ